MNKYMRAGISVGIGAMKCGWIKLLRGKDFKCSPINFVSPRTEITIDKGGVLSMGRKLKLRGGSKIQVRKNARIDIGNNVFLNNNCRVVARQCIEIGNDVEFGPGVLVYDHDHDFRAEGGISARKYKSSPVIIVNNVLIGANTVILRGTKIGDNCVIAAGSVVKGEYPSNVIVIQKRNEEYRELGK